MEGAVPAERDAVCTVIVIEADAFPKTAKTVPALCETWEPVSGKVAVAMPAEPTRLAEPRELPLTEKLTAPAGVTPVESVTVAIRYKVSVDPTGFKLLTRLSVSVGCGGVTLPPLKATAKLKASTEPRPEAWSYPAPAL